MSRGLISLIPKPEKYIFKLENWRPIILINNDAKVLALIFAQRLFAKNKIMPTFYS